jgi:hypothetical protein
MQSQAALLPHVMVHGTFDVANYGDLLFPHLLSFGLRPVAHRLTAVSPRGGSPGWIDAVEALPVVRARALAAALHVVGGGNIIHDGDTPLAEYRDISGGSARAYASLWRGAAAQAAREGALLAWNAPGVPQKLTEAAEALSGCDLLAVRDESSAAHLGPEAAPVVVPDTALDLARMWPAHTLAPAAAEAFARHGLARPARWVALHANARYLDGDAAAMAGHLVAVARGLDAVPVLLALGPCQGDDALARAMGAHLPPGSLVLDRPAGLREMAGLIAHAEGYAGSSLHGLITALSYGRPGLVVAGGALAKFAGFLAHVGMPERHLAAWPAAVQAAPGLLRPLDGAALAGIARAQDRIAAPWHRMRALLEGRAASAPAVPAGANMVQPRTAPAPPAHVPAERPDAVSPCPVCGGTEVRNVATLPDRIGSGAPCTGCGASARHRALRTVLEAIRTPDWQSLRCLRLGTTGRIAAAGWFLSCADAPESDGRYGVILAVDALEGEADLAAALATWRALLSPGGLLLVSMRTLPGRSATIDWGFARGDRNGEFRAFGADFAAALPKLVPGSAVLEVSARDPMTGAPALFLAVAEDAATLAPLRAVALAPRRPGP